MFENRKILPSTNYKPNKGGQYKELHTGLGTGAAETVRERTAPTTIDVKRMLENMKWARIREKS
jgi:hypothetical protein